MLRRTITKSLAVIVLAGMFAVTAACAGGASKPAASDARWRGAPGTHTGPPYHFVTELMGQFVTIPLKDQAQLNSTVHGYRYWSGQQNGHLVVTRVAAGLRFADTGTQRWRYLPPACTRQNVDRGIAAVCSINRSISLRWPLLVEIWPRLGNDFNDTSRLPATFAATVLGDKGNDTAHFGPGPDFFNGHSGRDRVWGGGGSDWIRAGLGDDRVDGGWGNDDLVAMEGPDDVYGGRGNDRVGGGDGSDRLWAGAGTDFVLCGSRRDEARAEARDRVFHDCESVNGH